MLGYAVTGRIRTSEPPMKGSCYYDRMDWWSYLASLPEPRVMVIEDVDDPPGVGAFVGEIHAAIGKALNCVGCVTNGAVRDLVSVKALGFSLFAGSVAVSHSYALIHGDRNGVHVIPLEVAEDVPGVARRIQDEERELMGFCRSRDFSLQALSLRMQSISKDGQPSPSLIAVPTPTK